MRLLVRNIKEMSADDATHMAAGVSYYALFSLFPLFLFLIAALSLVLETDDIRLRLIDRLLGLLPRVRAAYQRQPGSRAEGEGGAGSLRCAGTPVVGQRDIRWS